MKSPVDVSCFEGAGVPDPEVDAQIEALAAKAREFVMVHPWAQPIAEVLIAFTIIPALGLFLVRFDPPVEWPNGDQDSELWVVMGDLPPACIATDHSPGPKEALETYCLCMEEWADAVLAGGDTSNCYPVAADPTEEHAWMLKSRLEFIREKFIPIAGVPPVANEA